MKRIYIVAIYSIFILTIFAGCSPTAPPVGNEELPPNTQNYQVEIINLTEPVYETIRTENIDQPNCNGTGDVDNIVERTMGINHSIEVGLGLAVDIDGKLELFGTGVDLGAAISSELGYQYGVTESISRSITVRAAPKTHVLHTVKLSEVWESGTARVTSNGQSIDIPFRFRANFSIDLVDSMPVDCTTGQAINTQPVLQPTTVVNTASPNIITSQTELLGQWLYQQPRAPMPNPAGTNQVIFVHGDIDNSGTCHVKEFGPGEPVQGLGLGSFKIWLITGTSEYISNVEQELQNGAASHAGTDCPYLQ